MDDHYMYSLSVSYFFDSEKGTIEYGRQMRSQCSQYGVK